MEFKNVGRNISEYFRYRLGQKTVAFVLLLFFNFNIFSEIVPNPANIGTKVTRTASGVDQIDIARPNGNGTSYNSLRELQVGERGLILNNNKNVVVQTEKAGGKVIGSATNVDDEVGNNKEWLGVIGETNEMNLDNGKSSRRDIDQIMSANIPVGKSLTRYGNGVIFNNKPVVKGYVETEIYYAKNRNPYDSKNNYVLSNSEIVQIARNQKEALLAEQKGIEKMDFSKMTDYQIATSETVRDAVSKVVRDNGHRRYTYTSPVYSSGIHNAINSYREGYIDYATAQMKITGYERDNQKDYINLIMNGPGVWTDTPGVVNAVDELNRSRMITNYENGRYHDKGLNSINNMGNMNVEHIERVNVSVPEINTYLRWLRNEISN